MDYFQVLPSGEEYPSLDLKQMDCFPVLQHPAPAMQLVVASGHQLLNLEQVLKFSFLEAQWPQVFAQPRPQLQV
jgi:hypothetical protein